MHYFHTGDSLTAFCELLHPVHCVQCDPPEPHPGLAARHHGVQQCGALRLRDNRPDTRQQRRGGWGGLESVI